MTHIANIRTDFEKNGIIKSFQPGESVFYQDEMASHVGLIIEGSIRATSYSEDGTETWLGRFTNGDLLGHISILAQQALRYEAVAESHVSMVCITPENLNRLLYESREFSQWVTDGLAAKVDMMTMRLIEAYTLSAKGRICAELLRMSSPIGVEPSKALIRPTPVFVDLAVRVNSTRETVSRTVSHLQKSGILSREPGAILVHRPAALKSAIK